MTTKTDDQEREAFETWVSRQYDRFGKPNLTRAYMYGYVGFAISNNDHPEYASIQMLWEAWRERAALGQEQGESDGV